ncbi:hypothetical protein CO678_16050 [Bradyrhizobium diazoefficiens]|nr:hypothetical protein CO678_16050 [Bradyrhizobium diazoefficiens]
MERGLESMLPATDTIVAALKGDVCVVLKMEQHPTLGRWVAAIDRLEALEAYVFEARLFGGDRIGGRWIAVPGVTVGPPAGVFNWCRDSDFLDAVLKRLRKAVQPVDGSLTRAQISQLVTYLSRVEVLPADGAELSSFRERLKSFVPELVHNLAVLDELVDLLCALRPIELQLASRREEIELNLRRELQQQIRQEVEREMEPLIVDRDRLVSEVSELSANASRERMEAQQARTDAEQANQAVKDELSSLLFQLSDAPIGAHKTIRVLASKLGARLREQAQEFGILAVPGAPWTKPDFAERPFHEWPEFGQTLQSNAVRYGYDLTELRLIDVAARSGELVVLPEDRAARLVNCYAEAICGGDMVRQTLDPAILSVDDLWQHSIASRPTAFGRAWAAAQFDSSRFRIVLLEGLQRTPLDLWGPTMLDLLRGPHRPPNLLVFASIGKSFLDSSRVWRGMDKWVVAVSPTPHAGLTPQLLSYVSKRAPAYACFNATSVPVPTRDDLLATLTEFEHDLNDVSLQRLGLIYRAALALGTDVDAKAWAVACADPGQGDVQVAACLRKGTEWLRELLDNEQ